jgi:cell wall assembly regulator SMI1
MAMDTGLLKALVERIHNLNDEWDMLRGNKPSQTVRPPATNAQIAKLQKALDTSLPPDYVEMLRLHNGWENFRADYSLLSVQEMLEDGPMKKTVAELKQIQEENAETADHDGIIFLASRFGGSFCVYFDRSTQKPDGSMEVVQWDPGGVIQRHPSFTAYLESYKSVLEEAVERERKRLRA